MQVGIERERVERVRRRRRDDLLFEDAVALGVVEVAAEAVRRGRERRDRIAAVDLFVHPPGRTAQHVARVRCHQKATPNLGPMLVLFMRSTS